MLGIVQFEFPLFSVDCQLPIENWDSFCGLLCDMGSDTDGCDVMGETEFYSKAEGQYLLNGYN